MPGGRSYERPALRPIHRGAPRLILIITGLTDLVAIVTALVAATEIRFGVEGLWRGNPYGRWVAIWMPLWWVGLAAVGLYDRRRIANPAEELRRVVHGVTLGSGLAVVASFSFRYPLSRGWILLAWVIGLLAVMAGRRAVRKVVHALHRRGRLRRRALIVGADGSARQLAEAVADAPWEGLDVLGFVPVDPPSHPGCDPLLGSLQELREIIVGSRICEVLVAPTVAGNGHFRDVIAALDGVPVDLRIAPGIEGFFPSRMTVGPLGDRALLTLERIELRPLARIVKRAMDVVLGGFLMVVAAPVIGACALAVRLDSRGPAFFRQQRVGERGRPFVMWKLRTMRPEAERARRGLEARNEADGVLFKIKEDPRVTRVGRFLRRTSLDELPQLLNVLAGHMSLVGPRPPLPLEVSRYDERLGRRLLVKPGITGLWQVRRTGELSAEDYARYDLMYVENWSIALDLYILAKTVPAILAGRGAY